MTGGPEEATVKGSTYLVSDVMTRAVVTVGRTAAFKEIADTMHQWKVSALPVLDGEGRVLGVVSEADLLPKVEYRRREPSRLEQRDRLDDLAKAGALTAEELMSSPAVTTGPDATLAEAARIMARGGVKRLPVVDPTGQLKGIVSRSDLLKVFLRSDEDIAEQVRQEVTSRLSLGGAGALDVRVEQGVVTLTGVIPDTALVPLTAKLVRSIEGVVDVRMELTGAAPAGTEPVVDAPTSP